jgi:hypothetical protein
MYEKYAKWRIYGGLFAGMLISEGRGETAGDGRKTREMPRPSHIVPGRDKRYSPKCLEVKFSEVHMQDLA